MMLMMFKFSHGVSPAIITKSTAGYNPWPSLHLAPQWQTPPHGPR